MKKSIIRELNTLNEDIPETHCRLGCSQCCAPAIWSRLEWARLPEHMRKKSVSLTCQFLDREGRCEVYELRPVMCRLYGVVEQMPCPHASPERIMTKGEEDALIERYRKILRD